MPVPVIAAILAAVAFCTLRRPAMSMISAIREGTRMDIMPPSMIEASRMCHRCICSVNMSAASAAATNV